MAQSNKSIHCRFTGSAFIKMKPYIVVALIGRLHDFPVIVASVRILSPQESKSIGAVEPGHTPRMH